LNINRFTPEQINDVLPPSNACGRNRGGCEQYR
jgi:hypothetical protein